MLWHQYSHSHLCEYFLICCNRVCQQQTWLTTTAPGVEIGVGAVRGWGRGIFLRMFGKSLAPDTSAPAGEPPP